MNCLLHLAACLELGNCKQGYLGLASSNVKGDGIKSSPDLCVASGLQQNWGYNGSTAKISIAHVHENGKQL